MNTPHERTSQSLHRALQNSADGSTGIGFGLSRMLLIATVVVAVIGICLGAGALTRPSHSKAATPVPAAVRSSATPSPTATPPSRSTAVQAPVAGGTKTRTVYVPAPGQTSTRRVPVQGRSSVASHASTHKAATHRAPAHRAVKAAVRRDVTHQVTGWGCYAKNSAFYEDGRFANASNPKKGWVYHNTGGGDCHAGYDSMPMSGGWPDNGMDARFQFSVLSGTTYCAAATWVPATKSIQNAGGDPTGYDFVDSWDFTSGRHLKLAGVDEQAHRGHWVGLGTVRTTTGRLMLFEHGNGFDYNRAGTPNYAHHAVTQVRLTCWH